MKQRGMLLRWVLAIGLTLGLAAVLLVNALNPTGTLQDLNASEIAYVTADLVPPDETVVLSGEQVETLVDILHRAEVSHPVLFPGGLSGQTVTYSIVKSTGIQMTVVDEAPYLRIRGVTYALDDAACHALGEFASTLTD